MSQSEDDEYAQDGDLHDFIVDEPQPPSPPGSEDDDSAPPDRILEMTTTLKPNETQTQKLLRAHISVLVSALGGPDHTAATSPPPYKLGHDALACLKDIKRWIKSFDEKNNRYEVALACADSGLVPNDLVVILCQWETQCHQKVPVKNARTTEKIMLACLELLVLLTWPVEVGPDTSEHQKLLYADIKKAQLAYKHCILSHHRGLTIKAVIRLVLPAIAKSRLDREPRDNAVLRLVLFFLRNVLFIEPAASSVSSKSSKPVIDADNMPANVSYDDISLNTVLQAYHQNKALMLLLTVSGSLGSEFDKQMFGTACLECLYLLVRGTHARDVLGLHRSGTAAPAAPSAAASEPLRSVTTTAGLQLQDLLADESKKKQNHAQHLQTRHGRFGTLLSIRTNDANSYVVSGQEALHDTDASLDKLDRTKKWNTRSSFKYDSDEFVKSTVPVYLNHAGRTTLATFIDQFLCGGCFNTLIESVSSVFAGMTDLNYVDEYEKATFFLTLAWFFDYKRQAKSHGCAVQDPADFGSIGAGLSEVNFILVISYLRESFAARRWSSLHAAMLCFRELLEISQSLFGRKQGHDESQHEVDRELAEGIIRKLFSFSDFLNIIIQIPQTAAKHSPDYLSVSVSVVHIILKAFKAFAEEDVKLYIQTKRKKARQNKQRVNGLDKNTEDSLRDVIEDSDDEDFEERITQVKRERKLDFSTTEIRFFQTSIVSTYIEYLSRYEDLTNEEIKRCLSYFHRLFVVRKDFTGLYRLDFMNTVHKLRNYLPKGSSIRNHVEEFIYYFMKKFKLALARFPNPIEVLFPRFEDAEAKTYLATGDLYIKPESSRSSNQPRLAKALEFVRDNLSLDDKYKILVSTLHNEEKEKFLKWLIEDLDRILKQRLVIPGSYSLNPTPQFRRNMINSGTVRFLLSTIGFELPFILDEPCEFPESATNESLTESLDLVRKWDSMQPAVFEDEKDPSFFLRARDTYGENYGDDDVDYNGRHEEDDEAIAFVTEPNTEGSRNNFDELNTLDELERSLESSGLERGKARRKAGTVSEKPKSKPKKKAKGSLTRRRPPASFDVTSDEEGGHRPAMSAEYIRDSDDESDVEKESQFFEREERLRRLLSASGGIVNPKQLKAFKEAWAKLESSRGQETAETVSVALRETSLFLQSEDEDDGPSQFVPSQLASSQNLAKSDDDETPSQLSQSQASQDAAVSPQSQTSLSDESETEELDEEVERKRKADTIAGPRKRRVIVSDEEEE